MALQAEQELVQLRDTVSQQHGQAKQEAQRVRHASCSAQCSACTHMHVRMPTRPQPCLPPLRCRPQPPTAATTTGCHCQAEAVQKQLDKLGATLRQVEAYNDSFKGEVAVTRRAAHAAEAAVQQLEKTKQRQDYLVDGMQVRSETNEARQCVALALQRCTVRCRCMHAATASVPDPAWLPDATPQCCVLLLAHRAARPPLPCALACRRRRRCAR